MKNTNTNTKINFELTEKQEQLVLKLIKKIKPEDLTIVLSELKEKGSKSIINFLINKVGGNRKLFEENIEAFEKDFSITRTLNYEQKQEKLNNEIIDEVESILGLKFIKEEGFHAGGRDYYQFRKWINENVAITLSEEGEKINHLIKGVWSDEAKNRKIYDDGDKAFISRSAAPGATTVIFKNGLKLMVDSWN